MSIVQSVRRLAARQCGMATDEVPGVTRQHVQSAVQRLLVAGELHKAVFGHKFVRYYTDEGARDRALAAFVLKQRQRHQPVLRVTGTGLRAQWDPSAEAIIPAGVKVQVCPAFHPRFQPIEVPVAPHVFGGNQRGRVLGARA